MRRVNFLMITKLMLFVGFVLLLIVCWKELKIRATKSQLAKAEIEKAFIESWESYVSDAWGNDVYFPLSSKGHNIASDERPLGWIIIDSLDTIMIMYNKTDDEKRRDKFKEYILRSETWIKEELTLNINIKVSVFETTIRVLGGLLSAYYCSKEFNIGNAQVYLDRAVELADKLEAAFSTPIGIPLGSVNLMNKKSSKIHKSMYITNIAECLTLQMEFKYLSYITENPKYWNLAEKVYDPIFRVNDYPKKWHGLAPIQLHTVTGKFIDQNIRLGSKGDSYYEYLLKQYLLTHEKIYWDIYSISMQGIDDYLVQKSNEKDYLFIGEKHKGLDGPFSGKMDHLVCFMGGLYAMAATEGLPLKKAKSQPWWNTERAHYWNMATELTRTCYMIYNETPKGLAPEIVLFKQFPDETHPDWWLSPSNLFFVKPADAFNLLRPETVESIMYMYQLSKQQKYRDWAWHIFSNFRKSASCLKQNGNVIYSSISNVLTNGQTTFLDNMESFWLAETLKYLYLTFVDDLDLSNIVFNTEAHPFPVMDHAELDRINLRTNWDFSRY